MKNKEVVQQVVEAFLAADIEKALLHMSDDVKMGWPGFFDLAPGKDAIREFFKSVPEMTSSGIEDIIEEGNKVAATGRVTSRKEDGTLENSFFCDVYELENNKVKTIKSYMVFEQKKQEV